MVDQLSISISDKEKWLQEPHLKAKLKAAINWTNNHPINNSIKYSIESSENGLFSEHDTVYEKNKEAISLLILI